VGYIVPEEAVATMAEVLAFPGALPRRARRTCADDQRGTEDRGRGALSALVGDDLDAAYVIPSPFDPRVAPAVADAVAATARRQGVARL
jgi:malate dehydrogenase (oxaloacetate-decarboxylating)